MSPRLSPEAKERKAKEDAQSTRRHDTYVRRQYGLAPGEYLERLASQDGRCAICTRRPRNRRLAVDHDHNTGAVRGLLCYTCNKFVLGFVEFDPIAAHNAAVYLASIAGDFGEAFRPGFVRPEPTRPRLSAAFLETVRAAQERRMPVPPEPLPRGDLPF